MTKTSAILLTEALTPPQALVRAGLETLPAIIRGRGERASRRFIEFFTASIRNRNTRAAYARAAKQFLGWCEDRRLELHDIDALTVAAYVEQLGSRTAKPTVKQHLAAIRQLFAYLTSGGILEINPAASNGRLFTPAMDLISINARVDQALADNRRAENVLIGMAIGIFVIGVSAVFTGFWLKNPYVASGSMLTQGFLYWPIREVGRLRRDNLILQTFPALASVLPAKQVAQEIVKLLKHLRGEKE